MASDHTLVVDSDMHVIEPATLFTDAGLPIEGWGWAGLTIEGQKLPIFHSEDKVQEHYLTVGPELHEAAEQGFSSKACQEAMGHEGIDVAVLFPTRSGWLCAAQDVADPRLITIACTVYNEWVAKYARNVGTHGHGRCAAVAAVALYDPAAALSVAHDACTRLGAWGVCTRPNPVRGRLLSDSAYDPFWAALATLGRPVIFHEGTGAPEWIGSERCRHRLDAHITSHLWEQQGAVIAMIEVMARHPKLRVGFFEAGCSWVPSFLERLDDHCLGPYGAADYKLERRPSYYFKRQAFVTCSGEAMHGIEEEGYGRNVVFASDWPHTDGAYPWAVRTTRASAGRLWGAVSHTNAQALWHP